MTIPDTLYHFASPADRQSILTLGLSILFDRTGCEAIFMTDTFHPQSGMDCWEVDVRGLADIELDHTTEPSNEVWWMYPSSIEPNRLRLLDAKGAPTVNSKPADRAFGMFAAATSRPECPWNHIYGSRVQLTSSSP